MKDWCGVLIFPRRQLEPKESGLFQELLAGPRVRRVYWDELGESDTLPLGIVVVQLVIASKRVVPKRARRLIERSRTESVPDIAEENLFGLITSIMVNKFTQLSREDIHAMLGLENRLEQSRYFQGIRDEEQAKLLEQMLRVKGLSNEEIYPQLIELSRED